MINNPVLRLFLMLSIVIILIGILTIIFIQVDRGYVLNYSQSELETRQRTLSNHFYPGTENELKTSNLPVQIEKFAQTIVKTPAIQSQHENPLKPAQTNSTHPQMTTDERDMKQLSALDQIRNNNSIWQQRQARYAYENDYQMQLLRNNPWSPYYNPEKR